MLIEIRKFGRWHCYLNEGSQNLIDDILNLPDLLSQLESLATTLKENHRSRVLKGRLANREVVAKQACNKNKSLWARFLTLFQDGEARSTYRNLVAFQEAGLDTVNPLFFLEKRLGPIVLDSWLCYEYREGIPSDKSQLPEILDLLKRLHQLGYRHKDPHLKNFLKDENNQLFMIDCRGRPRWGNFSDTDDYLLLKKINPSLINFELKQVDYLNPKSMGYRLAHFYHGYRGLRTKLKKAINPNRPKNLG